MNASKPNQAAIEHVFFHVRLTPKGGRDEVAGWSKDANGAAYLKARVAAPPEDGKANIALLALLARALGVPKSSLAIVSGETTRMKRISVEGDPNKLRASLSAIGDAK